MTRAAIRDLKRKVAAGMRPDATPAELLVAREAALLLLRRSIAMKHDRLSLHRLVDALRLGAEVDASAWRHCTTVSLPSFMQETTGRS
jgi:hypothetical protein